MTTVNNLLDKAKEMRSIPTDMALADALHVGRAAVSGWRSGARHPDTVSCARISELTGEPLSRVLGIVGEARAITAEEKRVWRRLAQAAAIAAVALMAGWLPYPAQARSDSAIAEPESNAGLCIMRNYRQPTKHSHKPSPRSFHPLKTRAGAP